MGVISIHLGEHKLVNFISTFLRTWVDEWGYIELLLVGIINLQTKLGGHQIDGKDGRNLVFFEGNITI